MRDVYVGKFVRPMLDRYSPLAYSIMLHAHKECTHQGALVTLQKSCEIAFIIGGRSLATEIRNQCPHCRRFKIRLLNLEMGRIHPDRITVAPPFYMTQMDIMGPFDCQGSPNKRATAKVWALVLKCMATSAVSIRSMESYSSIHFSEAFTRHVSHHNFPKKLYIDAGAQLLKGCKDMNYSLTDWTKELNTRHLVSVEHQVCPVGAHNYNGLVERSIREIRKLFQTMYRGKRISVLGFETALSWVSNELNNLPLCTGLGFRDLDHLDLITPNRLMHGSNITRAPTGPVTIGSVSETLQAQKDIQKSWYECWEKQVIQQYIPKSTKWTATDYMPQVGDIVIFLRVENDITLGERAWRIGRIAEIMVGSDKKVRRVKIEYRNSNEKTFRQTERSPRSIAVIHKENESELVPMLNEAARMANLTHLNGKQ